jgi:hypothetical protein
MENTFTDLRNFRRCFIFTLLAAAAVVVASPARAQEYGLRYSMIVGSTDSMTQNQIFDSGFVQTNALTATLTGPGSVSMSSATPHASFGLLQLTASALTYNQAGDGIAHEARFLSSLGSGSDVAFLDNLTFYSSTLSSGAAVQFQIATVYSGTISAPQGMASSKDNVTSAASASLEVQNATIVSGNNLVTGAIGSVNQTNTLSITGSVTIGSGGNTPAVTINPYLSASGEAADNDGRFFYGIVNCSISSQTYVTILTPGVTYTAASGTVYPSLQNTQAPMLSIAATGNQSVTISWPAAFSNYTLQQNANLSTTNWVSNTSSVSVVNGTNQVAVSPGANQLFFRLIQ